MPEMYGLVALVSLAAATSAVAKRLGMLAPILLVLVGIVVSYIPDVPRVDLDPEVVFWGLLPPLVFVAAKGMSVPDFRAEIRPILFLAIGLVLVTAVAVGVVLHTVIPEVSLTAALALGAVVAPPDPVAASAVARRVGLPHRIVTILEGEGMLNDATALVLLGVLTASITGDAVTADEVAREATLAVVGGVVAGLGTAWLAARLHRATDDPIADNTVSLLTPFVAYAAAERIEGSGVLAVVLCGLYLGYRYRSLMSGPSRIQMHAFWKMVNFVLESVVFLLVGLQMRHLVDDLTVPTNEVVEATVAVLLTVILVRFTWIYPATYLGRLVPQLRNRNTPPPLRVPTLIGWAGMRGVITLAAALTLPTVDGDGIPVEHRDLLIWLAFAVIVGTLLIQGTTLAPLARLLRIPPDDPQEEALAGAQVQHDAVRAALAALDDAAEGAPAEVTDQLRRFAERRANAAWEKLGSSDHETPTAAYRRLRRVMLDAERQVYLQAHDESRIPDSVMRQAQRRFDLEESLL